MKQFNKGAFPKIYEVKRCKRDFGGRSTGEYGLATPHYIENKNEERLFFESFDDGEDKVIQISQEHHDAMVAECERHIEQQGEEWDYEESEMTHRDQCNADRSDYIGEMLERGEIDEENASELRMGA
jgi:hypothetical protein